MKALFILVLAIAVFGGAGIATYRLFIQPEQALKAEKLLPPPPLPPDTTIPEFNKCVALRKKGNVMQARDAFSAFIQQNPQSTKLDEAKDMLGDLNIQIYLSPLPSPDKETYIVNKGDVINRVAKKTNASGELIMRANNLRGTMLRIGEKLAIPQLDLSIAISHKRDKVTLLNKGRFFRQYAVLSWPPPMSKKPGAKATPPPVKLAGTVTAKLAWHDGTRITFADKGYPEATHWIQISIPHCTLHSEGNEKAEGRPPGGGIVLSASALEELAALLNKGDAVTLE